MIIESLKQKDIARVFWDADEFYYNNPNHEAGGFLREQREKWFEIDFKGVGDYFSKVKNTFDVVGCPKNIAQAKVAAQVLNGFSEQDLDASNTAIILADEPSGNLDSKNATDLHHLFLKLNKDLGQTFVIVTHNQELANIAHRKLEIVDGKIKQATPKKFKKKSCCGCTSCCTRWTGSSST